MRSWIPALHIQSLRPIPYHINDQSIHLVDYILNQPIRQFSVHFKRFKRFLKSINT